MLRSSLLRLLASSWLAVWLTAAHVSSHHSVAAQFDARKPVTLHGVVTRVAWENPHVWIYVDVTERGGRVVNWAIECAPPRILQSSGLDRSLVTKGDRVTITAYRARNSEDALAHAYDVVLPNGRRVVIGRRI